MHDDIFHRLGKAWSGFKVYYPLELAMYGLNQVLHHAVFDWIFHQACGQFLINHSSLFLKHPGQEK